MGMGRSCLACLNQGGKSLLRGRQVDSKIQKTAGESDLSDWKCVPNRHEMIEALLKRGCSRHVGPGVRRMKGSGSDKYVCGVVVVVEGPGMESKGE